MFCQNRIILYLDMHHIVTLTYIVLNNQNLKLQVCVPPKANLRTLLWPAHRFMVLYNTPFHSDFAKTLDPIYRLGNGGPTLGPSVMYVMFCQ